ncbi:MAG: 8-oxo-dGTP diphosphatase [Caldilineales bacterium]|nr:8-oxo-dGTP diphosphatase [Caldilineales bacterium]
MSAPFILTTLIYAQRGDQVLMLFRHKEPNLGLWIAPGGKIHGDESPRECAIRELREETGLQAIEPELRAIVTEISPRPDWQWLMFIYRTQVAPGPVAGDEREGRLRWFHRDEVPGLPIPQADAIFYPFVMDESGPPVEMKFVYDDDLRLVAWEHTPLGR